LELNKALLVMSTIKDKPMANTIDYWLAEQATFNLKGLYQYH
jgi:hypothetical protein